MTGWLGVAHLLRPADAAEYLAVSISTLNRLRRGGQLAAVRVGGSWRYDPTDVAAYITNNRSEA